MDKIKLGFLGLGQRGRGLITNVLGNFPDVDIVAVCDEYPDRVEDEAKRITEARGNNPAKYTYHGDLLSDPNVNTVIISASWEAHIPLAIEAMKKGKICGLEVGGGDLDIVFLRHEGGVVAGHGLHILLVADRLRPQGCRQQHQDQTTDILHRT